MLIVETTDLEIGSAAVRHRTSVAKYLPKSLRTLYGSGRTRAINRLTSRNATFNEIERQCHERSDFNHGCLLAARTGGNPHVRIVLLRCAFGSWKNPIQSFCRLIVRIVSSAPNADDNRCPSDGPEVFEAHVRVCEVSRTEQLVRFIPRRAHPHVAFLTYCQDHRHCLRMNRRYDAVRLGRQETVERIVRGAIPMRRGR